MLPEIPFKIKLDRSDVLLLLAFIKNTKITSSRNGFADMINSTNNQKYTFLQKILPRFKNNTSFKAISFYKNECLALQSLLVDGNLVGEWVPLHYQFNQLQIIIGQLNQKTVKPTF